MCAGERTSVCISADERTCGCVSVCVRHVTARVDVHQCMCAGESTCRCVSVYVCAGECTCRCVFSVCVWAVERTGRCVWRLCACDRRTGRDMSVSGVCACPVDKSDPIRIQSISAPKR